MGKASQNQNHEKTFFGVSPQNCVSKQTTSKGKRQKTIRVRKELNASKGWRPSGITQSTPQIPWCHLQITTSASLGASWSSKTGTSGCDQQISPGTFPSSRPFVKNLSRNIVQGHPRNGRPRKTRSRRPRSRRSREAMMNGIMPTGKHHPGHGNNP